MSKSGTSYRVPAVTLRAAQPEDALVLTRIALEAKAYWGYDADFMAACREALTLTVAQLGQCPAFVLCIDHKAVGFYLLAPVDTQTVELDYLFVVPSAIGHGYGRQLFDHARRTAREHGYTLMSIEADPHAAAFYERMGATLVGTQPSASVPGRRLPFFHLDLS